MHRVILTFILLLITAVEGAVNAQYASISLLNTSPILTLLLAPL